MMGSVNNDFSYEDFENYWVLPTSFRIAETFEDFVALNPDLRVEQKSNGEVLIVSPVGSEGSNREIEIAYQLQRWAKTNGGKAFSSSVLFTLPDGSKRGPDASWIARDRWESVSKEDREKFAPICPDFVIELRSRSDHWNDLQQKMNDFVANGVRLGWLIDPYKRQVCIYRPGQSVEILDAPATVFGEEVLPGFVLDLVPIWAV